MYFIYLQDSNNYNTIDIDSKDQLYLENNGLLSSEITLDIYKKYFKSIDPASSKYLTPKNIVTILKSINKGEWLKYLFYSTEERYDQFTSMMSTRAKDYCDIELERFKKGYLKSSEDEIITAFDKVKKYIDFFTFKENEHTQELNENVIKDELDRRELHKTILKVLDGYSFLSSYIQSSSLEGYDTALLKEYFEFVDDTKLAPIYYEILSKSAKKQLYSLFSQKQKVQIEESIKDEASKNDSRSVAPLFNFIVDTENAMKHFSAFSYLKFLLKEEQNYFSISFDLMNQTQKDALALRIYNTYTHVKTLDEKAAENAPLVSWYEKLQKVLRNYFTKTAITEIPPAQSSQEENAELNYSYLEEYSLIELVHKLTMLSQRCRRYSLEEVSEYLKEHERLKFLTNLILYVDNKETPKKQEEIESYIKEEQEKYHHMIKDKFISIKDGFIFLYDKQTTQIGFNVSNDYKNITKENLEEYSAEDLKEKFFYYLKKCNIEGILSTEVDNQQEKNVLLKKLFEMTVDGFEIEDISEYISLEENAYLRRFNTIFEMLKVGIIGIQDGYNPRILESKLLTFIDPKERKSLFED